MISEELSRKILTIGPDCHNPKGGVAQVIASFSTMMHPFRFVATMVDMNQSTIRKIMVAAKAILKTAWILRPGNGVEIVHLHVCSGNSFRRKSVFVSLARLFKKKTVLHMHGGGMREYHASNKKAVERVIAKADCIVALTKSWAEWYESLGVCRMVKIVPNPVLLPETTAPSQSVKDGFNLLFLGKLCKEKGVFDLLEAISKDRNTFENAGLKLILGGNGEIEKTAERIDALNISSIVSLAGWVDKEKKANLLNQADALILPSYREGFPICLLEAMAYSKPVIATPVGGIPEVLINGNNAILVEPGDVDAISSAIMELINNPVKAKEIGERGNKIALDHYPEKVEHSLEDLYNLILEPSGHRTANH